MPDYEYIRIDSTQNPNGFYADTLTSTGVRRVATGKGFKFPIIGSAVSRMNQELEKFVKSLEGDGYRRIPDSNFFMFMPLREERQDYEYCVTFRGVNLPAPTMEARQLAPDGLVLIGKAESDDELLALLGPEGWERLNDDIDLFKRPIGVQASAGEPATTAKSDPIDTLKRLGELRDSGVLTDDEFEAKKRDILAEM